MNRISFWTHCGNQDAFRLILTRHRPSLWQSVSWNRRSLKTETLPQRFKIPTANDVANLYERYKKQFPTFVKDDFSIARQVGPDEIGPDWPLVDRDESISALFMALFNHQKTLALKTAEGKRRDKINNLLIGCQSTSGGGKSTLVDYFTGIRLDPKGRN